MDVLVVSRGFAEELDRTLSQVAVILSGLDSDADLPVNEDDCHELRTRLSTQMRYSTEVVD